MVLGQPHRAHDSEQSQRRRWRCLEANVRMRRLRRVEVRIQQIAAERIVLSQDGPAPIHEFWQWGDVLIVI